MSKEYYKQCKFLSDNLETTAWIPEESAHNGYSMTFPDTEENRRWTVIEVSNIRVLKENLKPSDVFESIKK